MKKIINILFWISLLMIGIELARPLVEVLDYYKGSGYYSWEITQCRLELTSIIFANIIFCLKIIQNILAIKYHFKISFDQQKQSTLSNEQQPKQEEK